MSPRKSKQLRENNYRIPSDEERIEPLEVYSRIGDKGESDGSGLNHGDKYLERRPSMVYTETSRRRGHGLYPDCT